MEHPQEKRRGVWKEMSVLVEILERRDSFIRVRNRDLGEFWAPSKEIHVLPLH